MREGFKILAFAVFWMLWGFAVCCCVTKCGGRTFDEGLTPRDSQLSKEVKRDTVVVHDTIVEIEPVPVSNVAIENRTRKLPVAKSSEAPSTKGFSPEDKPTTATKDFSPEDKPSPTTNDITEAEKLPPLRDSIEVQIPITQVEYSDSNYQAWVSGFEPRLDSIRIFKDREIITVENTIVKTIYKNKRWGIGVFAGYGYTPKGFQPCMGVSVSYNIFNF